MDEIPGKKSALDLEVLAMKRWPFFQCPSPVRGVKNKKREVCPRVVSGLVEAGWFKTS